MDLVEGMPITDYCDRHQLKQRQRLELMIAVCQAIQHAHQKGIIHRDIKPSNVIVTEVDGKPVPKVIDFGVAKAIAQTQLERTEFTQHGQIIGTFEYMSPEQAKLNQLDIDTRSDIYSLGVLLYELLTGTTPFEKQRLETVAFDETLRIIREEEPPQPSTRVSSLALLERNETGRPWEPNRLGRMLRGELDWIVMKCLEKDRNRRYETASALAADLRHYLNNEPVTAAGPSRLYRASKFVRRNKGAAIASAAVLAGLIAGIIGMAVGLVSLSRQQAIAERERAETQLNLAAALQYQRKYAAAENLLRRELAMSTGATLADRQRAARTRLRLADVVSDRSSAAASEQLHREALADYRRAFPPGDPNIAHALINLAILLRQQERFDEAEPLFREVYEIHRRAIPADHRLIGESAANLANVLVTLGRSSEAEPLACEAIAEHQLAIPQDVWALGFAKVELGRALIAMGDLPEAETHLIEAERMFAATEDFRNGALALAGLYTAWDQAERGQGYDKKAREWVDKLIGSFVPPEAAPKTAP
jgi:non-specific serine/threonine protein kinase/serine/threonine-protein kinase